MTKVSPPREPAQARRERGSGHLRLRGHIWWIQYRHRGRTHRESSGSTKRTVAERKLRRRLGEIQVGEFVGPSAERIRYQELAADLLNYYITNGKKSLVRPKNGQPHVAGEPHLRRFFSGYRALEITTDRIREYVRQRQEAGAANATINRSLAALRLMFNLAARARKLHRVDIPIIEMLQERNVRTGFADDAQYESLARFYPELWWKAFLAVAYTFGWRKRNILDLLVRQVDLLHQTICLDPGTTKNDQGQTVKLTTEVYRLLMECVRGKKPADYVLTRDNGKPVKDFTKRWRTACVALGLGRKERQGDGSLKYTGLVVHDLRRSAVRNLERSGVSRSVAMKITGHKTEAVYRRYAIVSEADLAEAAQKLEQRRNDRGTAADRPAKPARENQVSVN
jgi:site-specific recombinase XerD